MTIKFQNPRIMGVLNFTPDSFSDGGKYADIDKAIEQAKLMVSQGADIIDIGGESTRPGAQAVSVEAELERVIPIISELKKTSDITISVDTSKPEVMSKALAVGVDMVNDVCALTNPGAAEVLADSQAQVCLMHMQGSPRSMQNSPSYQNVVDDIKDFFEQRLEVCERAGIDSKRIILDPGFGFGKTLEHNLEILKRFGEFKSFGLPVLAGLSRKSMIGAMLNDRPVDGRVTGSVIGAIIALKNGADIVRVHDVLETKDAIDIWNRVNG